MEFPVTTQFLREQIGLDANTISRQTVSLAIRERFEESGLRDEDAYLKALMKRPAEREALIDAVVVPETWFFRDGEPFRFLHDYVAQTWLPAHRTRSLRILSSPCASGEEPYSIAMTLAGLCEFSIDAVDISAIAIRKAKKAVYGERALRDIDPAQRDSLFIHTAGGWSVDPGLRNRVQFHQENAIDFPGNPAGAVYDVVFCRNLLIYLAEEWRRRLVSNIDRLLAPGGLLVLGHAEAPRSFFPSYKPSDRPRSFSIFKPQMRNEPPRKIEPTVRRERLIVDLARTKRVTPPRHRMAADRPHAISRTQEERIPLVSPEAAMKLARESADRGDLERAGRLCRQALQADPACSDAYYLLGIASEAAGNQDEAESYFEKALYLDPDHHAALLQMSLLEEKAGRSDKALIYRQRAMRLAARRGIR